MNRFIVVDFETTGNQPRQGDSIIQIGAVIVDDGQIVDTYSTYVNPERPIPPFITQLTGINDEMVADAPKIDEVLPEMLRRLDGRTFVAHNANFDLTFLQEALVSQGYYPFDGDVLDTVELARFLLPMQGGYRLIELANDFDIEHDNPHQADSDAMATAHLLLRLLGILTDLPLVTIQRLQMLVTSFRSDISKLLRHVEMEKMMTSFDFDGDGFDFDMDQKAGKAVKPADADAGEDGLDIYRQIALKRRKRVGQRQKQAAEHATDRSPDPSTFELDVLLEGLLGSEEGFSAHYSGYQRREAQEAMMRGIYSAMQEEAHLLVEAGTGTGKSLGYLLPSVLWAKLHRQQVVVSTHTIQLQDQLANKDVPLLERSLPFSFTAAQLKGRGNYICMRKFEQSLDAEGGTQEIQMAKSQILTWLTQTERGDVEELSFTPSAQMYWQDIKSDVNSCLHRKCPWFSRCYYFNAKNQAKDADIVIVNHALLVSDLDEDRNILPPHEVVIIDEAHQLEEVASQHFGTQLATMDLHHLLDRLSVDKSSMIRSFADELTVIHPDLKQELKEKIRELSRQHGRIRDEMQNWSTQFYRWASVRCDDCNDTGRGSVRYKLSEFAEKQSRIQRAAQKLLDQLTTFASLLDTLYRMYQKESEQVPFSLSQLSTDLSGAMNDFSKLIERMHFVLFQEDEGHVTWVELDTKGSRKQMYFHKAPLEVSPTLVETLFEKKRSVTLTSATLTVKNSFSYFLDRYGLNTLPEERVRTMALPSPFDYEEQGVILIPEDFPEISKESDPTYLHAVIQGCIDTVRAAEGRTMILFTSYSMLRQVYEGMNTLLDGEGYTLLGHGIDSNNRSKLVRKFQSEKKSVLLGAASFWEGVDIPGEALSCLIIVRLPFSPPNHPLLEGRSEAMKQAKKNAFMSLHLPHAIIRFKQGLGRLIRHQHDRGVVIVFDTRIVASRYGRQFLQSLPPYRVEKGTWPDLRERIRPFLSGMHPQDDS
ncbi:ATP-dependent DNA helicase DinG [Brevibacillus dissolubilis]|uniref:ATP-dependent DNA helicase DinG n=1 Tax=Brevibacillus dissolubilis TaxID=1844116 RepID=UPI001117AC0A|nr:ATP-dependent DNA helicase DinG [Brevibacillus dissolubilis]